VRAVIQRVSSADVEVAGEVVGSIGAGLVVLVAVVSGDEPRDSVAMADKVAHMRIFPDEAGRMNLSVVDIGGAILVVSQFTLAADVRRGRRPSFATAESPERAVPLIDAFVARLEELGVATASGSFGAMMEVSLVNDGPVTIVVDVVDGSVR